MIYIYSVSIIRYHAPKILFYLIRNIFLTKLRDIFL